MLFSHDHQNLFLKQKVGDMGSSNFPELTIYEMIAKQGKTHIKNEGVPNERPGFYVGRASVSADQKKKRNK